MGSSENNFPYIFMGVGEERSSSFVWYNRLRRVFAAPFELADGFEVAALGGGGHAFQGPVKKICQMARARGIEVVVDGAHAFAQFPFKRDDLDCDYYGTSLHKWVLAPIGTGMLYVRKSKIASIWPMMPAADSMRDDIRKFEEIGTHPASQRNAITEALNFHDSIGGERKAERFRYLRKRWSSELQKLPGVKILNSEDPEQSCAIGFISVAGIEAPALSNYLWSKHRIWTVAIVSPGEYQGLRITPNVYTTLEEIDTFTEVMTSIIKRGSIPS